MLQFKHNPKSRLLKWTKETMCIKEQNLLKYMNVWIIICGGEGAP